ncbi:TBC1 domain family member 1-like isoform X3 [Acipenser ruthenus]|uniref:TBC1 domain family member 1-like isoform X3 n=1 Tax=Acipenser ruthenus TaxID=7906 RepID=UPI002741529E|nr:TBC1 domain family member 1-like isoform X3 [Acipenser ruthenus]
MDTGGLSFEARQRTEPSSLAELSSAHPEKNSLYYRLQLVGFLPVHTLTTLPMLPWIVAEIRRHSSQGVRSALIPRWVKLYISQAAVCCEMDAGHSQQWDPLHYNIIFEHQPQRVYKLIHNSNDPSYFACLIREPGPGLPGNKSTCYVFRSADQAKVPEIISTIRQAGKTARQEEDHSRYHDPDDAFSKKFEVLFCGRVIVAHKKAPPALIDECIEKFNHVSAKKKDGETTSDQDVSLDQPQGFSAANGKHALFFQAAANGIDCSKSGNFSTASPNCQKTVFLKRDSSLPSFAAIGGNGVSPEIRRRNISEPCGVQPTDIQANRTMLFTIGQSQIYLISPDTKKVAIEKSFREISFCSQGIRHVDHFGFICRESSENGNCHFVCFVFQCTNEALVDEIMMTLKQAFSVAAVHHNSRTQALQCESCPMQHLHKLCERIEGLHPSKAKLEIQKHLATLNNKETAAVFEEVQKVRPKCEDEENELVISSLRSLYEEKQKNHSHSYNREVKQNCSEDVPNELQMSAGRLRLEMLKTRAKRSLTESLEGILSRGGNKPRHQKESFESVDTDNSSSNTTLHSINKEPTITDALAQPLTVSSVKAHRSTGDLQGLDNPSHKSPRHGFRHRSKTLSHLPIHSQQPLQPVEESPSIPKPRLMRHYSVGTETPHECSLNELDSDDKSPAAPLSAPTPPARLMAPSASSPNFFKSIKQNSGGEQSGCMLKRSTLSTSHLSGLRARLHSSSSVPNFLKFLAPVAENSAVDFKKRHRSSPGGNDCDSPVRSRRHSWRQQIFLRVATPQKGCDLPSRYEEWADVAELPSRVSLAPVCGDGLPGPVVQERKKTEHELRELWKKTILQQILLLRMEKENQKLQASESDLQNKRIKLDYEEITPCLKEVTLIWEKMLNMPGRPKIKFDMEKIHVAMGQGVPRQHRGEIWKFLAEQYQLHHPLPSKHQAKDTPYKELLKQLTSQQHAILIDLGRTFPTHPYFSAQLGAGQLSLYNLLKAYSLLDPEVGYCQGLSFVAGVLLLHMSEEDAFEMLKFLMYDVGLRKQYRPDMIILQIQMYQLSRLLHDYHRDLYNHLEEYEIGPSLYAAPWFLTIFASQFPLGFVARVFDMIFLQGAEVIFKVALSLLGSHKPLILQHDNLETIVDFIKTTLPNLGLVQMEKTIIQVFEMDISKQLQAYEVEYHVLQDELMDSVLPLSDNEKMEKLEKANSSLRQQNIDLLEEIQAAHAKIHYLELNIENFVRNEGNLKQAIRTLELERLALLNTVEELQGCMQTQDFTEDKTVLEQP